MPVPSDDTPVANNFGLTTKIYKDGSVKYICKASIGTALSAAAWQIQKIDTADGLDMQWCDGNRKFDNMATNLSTVQLHTYSY
jgi:hypothetical protein